MDHHGQHLSGRNLGHRCWCRPTLAHPVAPNGLREDLGCQGIRCAPSRAERGHAADLRKPVGILIVTRLIAQADEMVAAINTLAGRQVAVADHTEHRATHEQLNESDVLVITHQAYVNATQTLTEYAG